MQRDTGSACFGTIDLQTVAVAIVVPQPVMDVHQPQAIPSGDVQDISDALVIQLLTNCPQGFRRDAATVVNNTQTTVSPL